MGVGNYHHQGAETVYIDHSEIYGDEPDDVFDRQFLVDESLIPQIRESLPKSFTVYKRRDQWWADRERKVIAESSMYRITLVDWQGYFALNVEPIEDRRITSLAVHKLDQTAKGIFDALADQGLNLRIRCTAWTSGPYCRTQARAA